MTWNDRNSGKKKARELFRLRDLLETKFLLQAIALVLVTASLVWSIVAANMKKEETLTYPQQMKAMKDVEHSMKSLIEFAQAEERRLKRAKDLLNRLTEEREALEPIVEADRKTVQAIFNMQAKTDRANAWQDSGIGFGLGILASLITSMVLGIIGRLRRKKNESAADATE